MKRIYLMVLALVASFGMTMGAQTLIDEGFEDVPGTETTTTLPPGWERVDSYSGTNDLYRWAVHYSSTGSTMSGHKYMCCDAPTWQDPNNTNALGPRQEILMTPAVELDNTYQLSLDWEAAAYSVLEKGEYTFKVAVIDQATNEQTIVLDITDEQMVRDSGVPADIYGSYLWTNWAVQTSKIDLSAWQGKTVRIAFIYDLKKKTGNVLYLDNVSIKQFTPSTGPRPELSQSTYTFPMSYIGEKLYSEIMTIKNVGLRGLRITGYDATNAFGANVDTSVELGVNETSQFQIYYLSSLTSPTEGDIVIHTNGGDVTLHAVASKQAIPDGYVLELFEGEQFPPAGWTLGQGINQWSRTYYALEGDWSMYGSGYIEDSYINTPMLDLSDPNTPHEMMFTFYSQYYGEDYEIPGNDLIVQMSTDGGKTFNSNLWTADPSIINELQEIHIDLTSVTSDSVMLRFVNTAVYYDSEYGMDESANFIIDRVLLPGVAGLDGVPKASDVVAPADSAVNIYGKDVLFKWTEAQFAEGYRLYIGTSENTWNVLNGQDMGDALTYTLATTLPETTYYWKVVPYNEVGDAEEVPVWCFTTQPDMSIADFPWFEGFDSGIFAPLGWNNKGGQYTKWSASDYYPYDGARSAMAYSNETEVEAILTTPDVKLPAGSSYQLSFWWGNDRPVSLTKDETQVRLNHSTQDDGIDAVMMDINVDGQWTQLKLISDNQEGVDEDDEPIRYWVYENIDLTPYAGKTVAFRWRYISHNYSRSRGASLDNVKIEPAGAQVAFSTEYWDAYKVNANTAETSPEMALTNLGNEEVTVSSVSFASPQFSTTLKAGDKIAASESKLFTVTFAPGSVANGKEFVEFDDEMLVTLSDGNSVALSVSAIAMPSDTKFFGFEHDDTGVGPEGFTVIDVDRLPTSPLTFWNFPNNGMALSFFVLNADQCYNSMKEPHGKQSLMTRCNTNGTFEDWIVSAPMVATANSKFNFDMRNWESINSVLPASTPTVTVLVSTTSATDRNSFTQVGEEFKPELYNEEEWDHLSYDLSEYAGQLIYVALKAEASSCLGAFYDNFEFAHFTSTFDVNLDGAVDGNDLNCLINHVLGKQTWPNGDVNGDGAIDGNDINAMINHLLGK